MLLNATWCADNEFRVLADHRFLFSVGSTAHKRARFDLGKGREIAAMLVDLHGEFTGRQQDQRAGGSERFRLEHHAVQDR